MNYILGIKILPEFVSKYEIIQKNIKLDGKTQAEKDINKKKLLHLVNIVKKLQTTSFIK